MCRECVSLELSVLDDDSILEHQVQEIDAIFSPNGGFTSQLLVWFPTRLDHSMACVHVCIQVVGLDPKLDYGSVCWISGWQMEMFNRCRCQVQKGGAVESVSVGEIRVRLRQSLVKLGVGFISKDPKLQVLICDLEVVMRPSGKSTQKSRSRRSRSSGRGKWMVVANMCVVATSSYSWNKVDQYLHQPPKNFQEAGVVIKNVDITSGEVLSAPYLPSTPTPKMQLDHTPFEGKAYVSCQFHVLPELLAAMVQISGPPSRPLHPNSRDSSPLVEQ
ncbi:unnamed protein product [Camellia sinensis]